MPVIVNDAPLLIVMLLPTAPAALITGMLGAPEGMTTSVPDVGDALHFMIGALAAQVLVHLDE